MQALVLIERAEWELTQERLGNLEQMVLNLAGIREKEKDEILTNAEAAAYLNIDPESVRRARRQKRLTGVKINERDYGYRKSELIQYLKRYQRAL